MANNFKSYMKNKPSREKLEQISQNVSENDVNQVERIAAKYQGMSDSQMMNEISKMAAAEKRSGNLRPEDVDRFVANVMPMLEPEQQAKLQNIAKMLKK